MRVMSVVWQVARAAALAAWRTPVGEVAVLVAIFAYLAMNLRIVGVAVPLWLWLLPAFPVVVNAAFAVYTTLRVRRMRRRQLTAPAAEQSAALALLIVEQALAAHDAETRRGDQ